MLTVTAATLQSIAVTPASPSITKGLTEQFTATGTYSDSSTQNLTNSVTWASGTTGTATITTGGLATGAGVGTSTISATSGPVVGSTVLTVTAATLQSIAVTPANPSITKGLTEQFTATGTYSDSSTQNLTNSVTWALGTMGTATITTGGLATGAGVGTSSISATLGSVVGSTVLTVTPATLQSIAVTPANPTITKGLTEQFTATGTYSDSSTQNLTNSVTWASGTMGTATITVGGLATGAGVGRAASVRRGVGRGLDRADGNRGDPAIDRRHAGESDDHQGSDRAVHGDRDLQRQQHAESDELGDVGVGDAGDGDHRYRRFGDGRWSWHEHHQCNVGSVVARPC